MDSSNRASRQTAFVDMGVDEDSHDAVSVGSSQAGYGKCRIQPIDTRIRLQLGQKQGLSVRSRVNYGNTHIMASQPGPVNISISKLVESGMTFVEARKHIARATREEHQKFVRQGEQELAKEMSFRDVQERARNAHTQGPATLTNKIERMHRRVRERQARDKIRLKQKTKGPPRELERDAKNTFTAPKPPYAPELSQADSSRHTLDTSKLKDRHKPDSRSSTGGSAGGSAAEGEGGQAKAAGEHVGGTAKGEKAEQVTNEVAFVLRKLYTGRGLDAQQQGWKSLPMDLFNTLTLQMGTMSKINIPRNSLELLVSLRNPNFSCAHMRSVTEINLSGNDMREFPEEAQRLTSLRTLRLDNNKLSGLPEGLLALTCLTSLSLRHNNFSLLPYRFGDLRFLQKLDLGENMLKTLPPTMGLLTSLKHLKLDGNNMPHLAIPPPLKTTDGKDHSNVWAKRWDRKAEKEVWINGITGEASEADPTSSAIERNSNASGSTNSSLVMGTFQYNRRRNTLATRGVYEWEAALNVSTGKVYYINNVNFGTSPTLPACMDRLGEMANLVTLKLSQNKLRSLPSSMEILEANNNYLEKLPAKLGDMKRLKYLRLDVNCLSELPGSMVQLKRLEELCLTSNFFATFPEFAMKMSGLKKLLLGNNQLRKLPYSVGFLSSLETLQLYNNPLADPPAELLLLGMGAMLWECRRRHWVQVRGNPPTVRVHGFGIEEEKLELQPEFNRKLANSIKTAGKTGELNFMMEGLTYFPMAVFGEEVGRKLKSLRLDSNNFSNVTPPFRHTWQDLDKVTHSVSLCNLMVLSLKSCKLRRLGNDVAELGSLKELYLESNLILNLPETFTRLRTLEILDMKKNQLQDCPDEIGALSRLKRLELDGNRLEVLPPSLSQLTQLEVLTLSSNHVYRLPDEIVDLERLKTLDVNGNMLTHLPSRFGSLRLKSLKLSYNRLETLRHEVFLPTLKGTLKKLWLSNNNLLQLPDSLIELSKAKEVQMDSNPFKSPPSDLLAEGLSAVMLYLRVRIKRIALMHKLILDRGFDTSLEVLLPECSGVLLSDTGYLTPADLDELDKAIDRFINGDFYRHPLSAEVILNVALELRDTREREFYERMVEHLMARIMFHETQEIFSTGVFCRHTTRPWGRRKGPVGAFAIALSAVLDDTPRNAFVEEFRPSLWTEAKNTLPKSVFDYSVKALRKALISLKSAYGPIAKFEEVTFDFCECVDSDTGEELRHPKGECTVKGLVLVKIIYTPEEAARHKDEDGEVTMVFESARKQVWDWLKTKQGQVRVTDELKKRKAAKSFRIGIIGASISTQQAGAVLKQEMFKFAQQRQMQYESGEPFHFHSLNTAEEATALVQAAEKEVEDVAKEIANLEKEKTRLLEELKERAQDVSAKVEENLLDKYCYLEYTQLLKRNRTIALKNGWRRPWDGMDGEDFVEWAKSLKRIAAERHERPENVEEYKAMPEPRNERRWDESPAELAVRLSWEGTDNMDTFRTPRLLEWKTTRGAIGLAGGDVSPTPDDTDEENSADEELSEERPDGGDEMRNGQGVENLSEKEGSSEAYSGCSEDDEDRGTKERKEEK